LSTASDSRISIIGAGSWGTALAILLSHNLGTVDLWGHSSTDQLLRDGSNERHLPGIKFADNLVIHSDLEELVNASLNFLVVVPSHAFREILKDLKTAIEAKGFSTENTTLLWGTKGFDPHTGALLSEVVTEEFGKTRTYGTVSGPSFAKETASGMPTALTLACSSATRAEQLSHWFRTPNTRVYFSDDLIGVQLGGAIKNVMAVATGISDGLGFGANARAALITRGLAEMIRLGVAMGGQLDTFNGLSGVGDLILTCTDNQSRNRRFGLGIGANKPRQQIIDEIGQEIEGIQTTRELFRKGQAMNIEMPITEQVYRVLYEDLAPDVAVKSLLSREPKAE